MQLIKITNVPIEYKIEIEPARLEMKQSQNPKQQLSTENARVDINTRNIQVRLDMTDMRASLNLRNSNDFAHYYGDKGNQTAYRTIGENVQLGNQMQRIDDGVTISQIMKQKMLEQPSTYTVFLPAVGPEISWEPPQTEGNYQPAALEIDWEVMRNMMDYIPGKFTMNITQYPKVQIEYLGEPTYVPPSSDPNYEGESA